MAGERGIDPRATSSCARIRLRPAGLVQYGIYVGRVLHGDLGKSIDHAGAGADASSAALFPATIELAICAIIFALVLGLPAGMHRGGHDATRSSTMA